MTPKYVYVYLKHDDRSLISLLDKHKSVVAESNGYMPYVGLFVGGDDTELLIDNETGCIVGWKPIETLETEG